LLTTSFALNAGWDSEILAIEFRALIDLDFDLTLTGFLLAEVDVTLDQARAASTRAQKNKPTEFTSHWTTLYRDQEICGSSVEIGCCAATPLCQRT
jgi:hypothetical protein